MSLFSYLSGILLGQYCIGGGGLSIEEGGSHSNLLYTMRASAISWSLLA